MTHFVCIEKYIFGHYVFSLSPVHASMGVKFDSRIENTMCCNTNIIQGTFKFQNQVCMKSNFMNL